MATLQKVGAATVVGTVEDGVAYFSADEQELVATNGDAILRWHLPDGKPVKPRALPANAWAPFFVASSAREYVTLSISIHNPSALVRRWRLALWDKASMRKLWHNDTSRDGNRIKFSPRGDTIVMEGPDGVTIFDSKNGKELRTTNFKRSSIRTFFNSAGDAISVHADWHSSSTQFHVYSYPAMQLLRTIPVQNCVTGGFWPDDNTMAFLAEDGTLTTQRVR